MRNKILPSYHYSAFHLGILVLVILISVVALALLPNRVIASVPLNFTPPTQVTLTMYALDQFGRIVQAATPCQLNDVRYGCTYFDGGILGKSPQKPYPFTTPVTITIGMENQVVNGIQQGYVHNVISQEMLEGSPLASYTAQAITARTYAYYQTQPATPGGPYKTINNSGSGGGGLAGYQVYLPYRFDGLGEGLGATIKAARQAIVNNAVTQPGPLYMVFENLAPQPIFASFGADNCSMTQQGTVQGVLAGYLYPVYDPISLKTEEIDPNPPHCQNSTYGTPNGGMGSNGASRWGLGNTSALNSGNPWSVRWDNAFQILTHYYTGIHIVNTSGQSVTPVYRWNPLSATWSGNVAPPAVMSPNTFYPVQITYQNTSVFFWPNNRFAYQWKNLAGTVVVEGLGAPVTDPIRGNSSGPVAVDILTPLSPGWYTLMIDRQIQESAGVFQYLYNREPGKPWYPLQYQICISSTGQCHLSFLPIILKQ